MNMKRRFRTTAARWSLSWIAATARTCTGSSAHGSRWIERERIPAFANVFQVGPLLSPTADRLLFAQADGARSGELFLIDLVERPDERWPACSDVAADVRAF